MNRRLAALLVPVLLAVAGCTATPEQSSSAPAARSQRPSPFADCATLATPPAATPSAGTATSGGAVPSGEAAPSAGAVPPGEAVPGAATATGAGRVDPAVGKPLPELTLSCFTGGVPVALRDVRGPAVINVWASWCGPCRKELPAFQRLSARTTGKLQVVGVNSRDDREAAQSFGEDFGVRFPMLVDQGAAVQRELRRKGFPLTVFVDAQGQVRHVDDSGAVDDARLAALVRTHLGVAVPA
ncbi:redoxin domain-containing protein [Micromonospora sp. NPDC000089]|uniref:TlpA family protein disulfide reductase n=1 Tax=unclassified Micromonospora TaxID=2617518 RepID=UPI003679C273